MNEESEKTESVMTTMVSTSFIVSVVVALLLCSVLFGGQLPKFYNTRPCQGKGWRETFPSSSKQGIRAFLAVFVNAFACADNEKLKLKPEDKVLDIYRAIYPLGWVGDALELETLAKAIQVKYGFSLGSVWHESLTLGELFQITQNLTGALNNSKQITSGKGVGA